MLYKKIFTLSLAALAMATVAGAQVTVTLPDVGSQTTLLTADVSEQADVTVPTDISFTVDDISVDTPADAATPVTVTNIVLVSNTAQLKISVAGSAASFSGAAIPYDVGDVGWNPANDAVWVAGTADVDGVLLNGTYAELVLCDADTADCSTGDAKFYLRANTSIMTSGPQTLTMSYKFERIGA